MSGWITIALPKGRLGTKAYELLERSGYACPQIMENSRKLIFENTDGKIRYFLAKPSDVAIYVERGVADYGIVGKDILMEYRPNVLELLDLGMGNCMLAVAAKKDMDVGSLKTVRVATKFECIAGNYFERRGREMDVIHLNGSIEIAPILGLSDCIVDIVESGKTLMENDLEVKEKICDISARLIANRASFALKKESMNEVLQKVMLQLENDGKEK